MSIIKNEIPILEFDTEQTAVISPVHENLNLILPKNVYLPFLANTLMNMRRRPEHRLYRILSVRPKNILFI